jgi:hypothetical protein
MSSIAKRIQEVTEELAKLQLKQDKFLIELKGLGQQATTAAAADNAATAEETFREGTRITVKNPTAPLGRSITAGDRTGTVTRVTSKKVFFDTDSGQLNRNRLKKNVLLIVETEPF